MDVLAMIPLYPPQSRVGAWISTHECLAHLAARGHRVDVIQHIGEQTTYELDGVKVHPKWCDPRPFVKDADVIVSHLGDQGHAARLSLRYGRPLVRMVHGTVPNASLKLSRYETALAVFNSESLRESVAWRGNQLVMHPPVRIEDYATTPGKLVTLVNLGENKGGALFWRLAEALPEVKFLGVKGSYERQIEGELPNVETIGSTVNMRDEVYARTRLLLMPSERETWGRTGIEAMCSGIPVIAHPTPGLRESLGAAGVFIDRDDDEKWCKAIVRLLKPAAWKKASAQALERVEQLDPAGDLDRFATAVESLVSVPA